MTRKKILWLCSWYPGETDPFNGDFIQRHARAAALFNDIHVIHVAEDKGESIRRATTERKHSEGLIEDITYLKKRKNDPIGRLAAHYRWLSACHRAIREYVKEFGKPALIHVNVPFKAGLFGIWIKRKYGTPYVVTEHWGIYNDVEKLNYEGRSNKFKLFTRKVFSLAAQFISVSRYLGEGVNRMVLKKEYEVIPNVADTDLFYYKAQNLSAVFRFIHVSNMVPLKNTEGILLAFKQLLDRHITAELVLAGDTDPVIREYAVRLGLTSTQVFFRGEIPYEQVAGEMQQSHCLVLFSNIENSPCVIGEALCCGLPVIATNVGGIPELVNKSNGVLIEPKEEQMFATAMELMIAGYDQYDRKKIAEDAFDKFSYKVIGMKLDKIYDSVISTGTNF